MRNLDEEVDEELSSIMASRLAHRHASKRNKHHLNISSKSKARDESLSTSRRIVIERVKPKNDSRHHHDKEESSRHERSRRMYAMREASDDALALEKARSEISDLQMALAILGREKKALELKLSNTGGELEDIKVFLTRINRHSAGLCLHFLVCISPSKSMLIPSSSNDVDLVAVFILCRTRLNR
eukprot:m.5459 g.5459  ORF g.5459 m.5459 type:complete len:185 (-) comp4136_c0_seq1:1167-1721(-)